MRKFKVGITDADEVAIVTVPDEGEPLTVDVRNKAMWSALGFEITEVKGESREEIQEGRAPDSSALGRQEKPTRRDGQGGRGKRVVSSGSEGSGEASQVDTEGAVSSEDESGT